MDSVQVLINRHVNELFEDVDRASRCASCSGTMIEFLIGKYLFHYACHRCGNRWKAEKGQVH